MVLPKKLKKRRSSYILFLLQLLSHIIYPHEVCRRRLTGSGLHTAQQSPHYQIPTRVDLLIIMLRPKTTTKQWTLCDGRLSVLPYSLHLVCRFRYCLFTMETLPIKVRSRLVSELSCKSQVKEYESFLGLAGIEGLDVSVLLENEQGE